MKAILNKPYPFLNNSYAIAVLKALMVGTFMVFFLYHFDNDNEGLWFFIKEAWLVCCCQFLFLFAIPKTVFKNHDLKQITIWQYVICLMLLIITGYASVFLFNTYYYNDPFSFGLLNCFLKNEIPTGALIIFIVVCLDYMFLLRQELATTKTINNQISIYNAGEAATEEIVHPEIMQQTEVDFTFYDEQQKRSLTLKKENVLFVKGADNYIEIYFLNEKDTISKELLRNKLTNIETDPKNDFLIRVHRSYLCNLNKVSKMGGNSKGYLLHFSETDESVSVSRAKSDEVVAKINQLFKN